MPKGRALYDDDDDLDYDDYYDDEDYDDGYGDWGDEPVAAPKVGPGVGSSRAEAARSMAKSL